MGRRHASVLPTQSPSRGEAWAARFQLCVLTSLEAVGWDSALTSSFAAMADLNPRMLSPKPFPSSGSFLGPKTRSASPNTTSMCIG
jgi:hypothetical protein